MTSMKVYRAILHTGGKTREQIEAANNTGVPFRGNDMAEVLAYYKLLDGAKVYVTDGFGDGYSLACWPDEEETRMKEAAYLAEQDRLFGTYINMREEFDRDWDAGNYCPDAIQSFDHADVEILGEVAKIGRCFDDEAR
jgi:hypothetical protein